MFRAQSVSSLLRCLFTALLLAAPVTLSAQAAPAENLPYARVNSFGFLIAYSNDSSHILMGGAEQRKILNIGASYSRRILLTHVVNWQYDAEILPVALESDPLSKTVIAQTSPTPITTTYYGDPPVFCAPSTFSYTYTDPETGTTYAGTSTTSCHGRQWTIGEAISPVGMRWNFLPRRKLQPFFEGHGGDMFSTHPIPVETAGSFNFTFDFGVGLEWYRTHSRSLRFEYRFHHISDHDTTDFNPGIDNGLFQVSYVFGH